MSALVEICGSIGPRIGDTRPRCGRARYHRGPHSGHPGSGFERETWSGGSEMRDSDWARDYAEHLVRQDVDPAVRALISAVLTNHQRTDPRDCNTCGPQPLGASFSDHQTDMVLATLAYEGYEVTR